MKNINSWLLFLLCFFSLYGCRETTFVVPSKNTPLYWEENDLLYNNYFYEKIKSKPFFSTDSTVVIDKTGTKALIKIRYEKGCITHDIKVIIPSQTIENQQFDLPWMIAHNHEYAKCQVDVIARYTLDLSSIAISRDWRANPPTIVNTSQINNPLLEVLIKK